MKRKSIGILTALVFAGSCCLTAKASSPKVAAGAERPNIVMLFIDDWAWNGTPVRMDDAMPNSRMPVLQMPNLDRLARQGMRFRNAYAGAPQCSPSRVCLQTGQSTPRSGFSVFMNSGDQTYYDHSKTYQGFPVIACISDMTIDPDTVTIPEALQPFGYACAHFGKWHMRGSPEEEGYVAHDGDTTNNAGNQDLPGDPKLMFSITERAIDFMDQQVKAKTPFYLQISHYFHYPHYRTTMPHSAVVSDTQKVIHFYERPEIPMRFDLALDEGEVKNVAKQNPETHQKLYDEMMRYFEEVGARMPKVNPEYDPEVYKKAKEYEPRIQWGPFEGQRTVDNDEI
jgi:hypothetical protein